MAFLLFSPLLCSVIPPGLWLTLSPLQPHLQVSEARQNSLQNSLKNSLQNSLQNSLIAEVISAVGSADGVGNGHSERLVGDVVRGCSPVLPGVGLSCLTCCEGNHCTSHEYCTTPAHPRASPLCPQAGSSGIFLRALGCFSCQLYTVPSPCANTRSIFVKTTKRSHLLSFFLSFLLLFPLMLISQRGLDALGPLPSFFGSSCLAVVGTAPTGRGQSRLLLVSHLFALCHGAVPSWNLSSPHVCL